MFSRERSTVGSVTLLCDTSISGSSKAYSQLPTSLPQGPGRYLPTMSWWHSSQGVALLKTCSWKLCSLTGLSGAKGRGTGHGEGVGVGRPLSADAGGGEGGGSGVGGVSSTSVGHFSSEPERRKKFSTLLLRRMVLRERERLNRWSWERKASYECLAGDLSNEGSLCLLWRQQET